MTRGQRMDRVFIEGLEAETVIGASAWERDVRQRVRLDLDMDYDCRAPARTDALEDALDYARVATRATAVVEESNFELVEALAERVAATLLAEFPIARIRLRVRKPGAVGNAAAVGVVIERAAAA